MSDTPRTDAEVQVVGIYGSGESLPTVDPDFARELERELAAKSAEATRLRDALEHLIERCETSDGFRYGTLSTSFVREVASDALSEAGK